MCLTQKEKSLRQVTESSEIWCQSTSPPRLPEGTAELLDDVIGEVLKYIKGGDHLVVIEGFRLG